MFETCKDIPLDTTGDYFYLNEPKMTSKQWCSDKVAEEGECFRGTTITSFDVNCKCPNQDCHNLKKEL